MEMRNGNGRLCVRDGGGGGLAARVVAAAAGVACFWGRLMAAAGVHARQKRRQRFSGWSSEASSPQPQLPVHSLFFAEQLPHAPPARSQLTDC
mmetsp:Transcript_9262/g.29664  ORF Transcript_9262/g.29664 Transcript_9262/m.29664 type:complete len:93 (-) Transcript_9262:897-1175(-)